MKKVMETIGGAASLGENQGSYKTPVVCPNISLKELTEEKERILSAVSGFVITRANNSTTTWVP